jgi:phospho-N-acetylmuramoyl-pentapeptide-transferase
MLMWLAQLETVWGPFRLFDYVTTRVVMAAVTAFALMLMVMPPLIRWLRLKKFGESGAKNQGAVVVDAMREAKKGTPTMGGLGLVACICVSALLWCNPAEPRVWLLLFGLVAFAVVGYLDDRTKIFKHAKGASLWVKLSIQLGTALLCGIVMFLINEHYQHLLVHVDPANPAALPPDFYHKTLDGHDYLVRLGANQLALPFVDVAHAIPLGVLMIFWVVFVMTACANGVNFTDGMDGLAGGTMLIAALAFMVIAYLTSSVVYADYLRVLYVSGGGEVAVFCAAIAGACLGFLWFNGAPAEVFMGDTGSQALGGALGLIALNTKQEFLIVLVGFIFVVEALSVALQIASFRLTGKRIFLCAPVHHHFQSLGWPESKIVLRFWITGALVALLALGTLKLH